MKRASRGLTLIELLIFLALVVILSSIVFRVFRTLAQSKSLDGESSRIVAEFARARSLTLASKYADQYGIHIATTSITLFQGSSYSASSASNTVMTLSPSAQIASSSIAGGGSNVIFQRLTGGTTQSGTLQVSLKNGTSTKIIIIYKTGAVEIQ